MPHYKLEKGVTMTENARYTGVSKNKDLHDLLRTMEVGESFTIPNSRRGSIESVISITRRKVYPERRFAVRKEDNVTTRIWRVK